MSHTTTGKIFFRCLSIRAQKATFQMNPTSLCTSQRMKETCYFNKKRDRDNSGQTQPRVESNLGHPRAEQTPYQLGNGANATLLQRINYKIIDIESHFNSRDLFNLCIGGLSARRFWATDGTGKWAFFLFYLASHNHIYIVKNILQD